MRKDDSQVGSGGPFSPSVDRKAVQIELPFGDASSDPASSVEGNRGHSSGAATPVGEGGPKRRKWYSLYDKVLAPKNLRRAWEKVKANGGAAGCDGQTIAQFGADAEAHLQRLYEALREKRYRPRPVKRVEIPKSGGGVRRLGIPCVGDRVVQQAVLQVLGPIFDPLFSECSHGFRPGRGCQSALEAVEAALRAGQEWVVDADIVQFFDTVDHELVLDRLNDEIADGSVLRLIRAFLRSGVLVERGEVEPTELGTPQGGPLSPLLANLYLHPLDQALEEAGFNLVRYADDFVIFTKTRQRAEQALELVQTTLERLKLHLHPEKTRIATLDQGFDFLGYRYFRDGQGRLQKSVSGKSRRRFRDAIRKRTKRHAGQKRPKARRCTAARLQRNQRVQAMVARVNQYLRGWHGYFRGVRVTWRDYLNDFDRFVRVRLRCAISGRYAKGRWHQILSNDLFDQIGLLSLADLQRTCDLGPFTPPTSGYSGGSRVR
jgi:RNA-directed DNA polymerase